MEQSKTTTSQDQAGNPDVPATALFLGTTSQNRSEIFWSNYGTLFGTPSETH